MNMKLWYWKMMAQLWVLRVLARFVSEKDRVEWGRKLVVASNEANAKSKTREQREIAMKANSLGFHMVVPEYKISNVRW